MDPQTLFFRDVPQNVIRIFKPLLMWIMTCIPTMIGDKGIKKKYSVASSVDLFKNSDFFRKV